MIHILYIFQEILINKPFLITYLNMILKKDSHDTLKFLININYQYLTIFHKKLATIKKKVKISLTHADISQ